MVLNQQVNNDDANPLCCCEYENERGERSHLLAFCCDCAELDEAVDRLISRKEMPNNAFQQIYGVLEDRFR